MTIRELARITEGDSFTHGGFDHVALEDASTFDRFGFRNVHIQTKRRSGNLPGGWELCTVAEREEIV